MKRTTPSRTGGRAWRGLLALLVALALAAVAAWFSYQPPVPPIAASALPLLAEAQVDSIDDGDSFVARVAGHGRLRVRLHAVDTPERVQAYGAEAREGLRALIAGRRVTLDCYKRDPRGRAVCRVALARNGTRVDIGLALVEQGLAWHFRAFIDEQTADERRALQAAEAQARRERRGLWQQAEPMPPWTCRERLRSARPCT